MDQHAGEKDADDNKSQDSADQQREDDAPAAAGYKAAAPLLKEVTAGSDESSSPAAALFAHPCSLLQLLLRSCAGCLGLHGDDPKPAAAVDAPDDSSAAEEGEGGDKANYLYMQQEVEVVTLTQVLAVRRPRSPGNQPSEGGGGNGGVHH